MPKKKYNVALSSEEEAFLKSITHAGSGHSAREVLHAQVLLHSNDNKPALKNNREIAEWFGISPTTVNQIRKSYSENGLKAALYRKTRIKPPVASKITGDFEAKVIATALAPPVRFIWMLIQSFRMLIFCISSLKLINVSSFHGLILIILHISIASANNFN